MQTILAIDVAGIFFSQAEESEGVTIDVLSKRGMKNISKSTLIYSRASINNVVFTLNKNKHVQSKARRLMSISDENQWFTNLKDKITSQQLHAAEPELHNCLKCPQTFNTMKKLEKHTATHQTHTSRNTTL